jgi:hypothetical protein
MALSLLGSATRSVPDFVRTDLRTVRLAIARWRPHRQSLQPSQVALRNVTGVDQWSVIHELGRGAYEQAWKEHHTILCSPNAHAEWERKDTHIAPVLPECARGTNRIAKSREVLPPWAQLERYAYPSREAQQASLEGPFMRRCSPGQSARLGVRRVGRVKNVRAVRDQSAAAYIERI